MSKKPFVDRSKRLTERLMMLGVGDVEVFDKTINAASVRVAASRLGSTGRVYSTRQVDEGVRAVRLK